MGEEAGAEVQASRIAHLGAADLRHWLFSSNVRLTPGSSSSLSMVRCAGTRRVLDLWRHFPPPKSVRVHAPQAGGKYLWWSMTLELTLH